MHTYTRSWEHNGKKVIECGTCGYIHLYSKPSKEELTDFYQNRYHSRFNYKAVDESFLEAQKKTAANHFYYSGIYENVLRYLETDNRNMLDLGCGTDLIAVSFKGHGWNAYAVEPNTDACEYINKYGVKGYNCFIEDMCDLPKMAFINSYCVLEHVQEPMELLRTVSDLLDDGGIARIAVPNDFNDMHMAYMECCKKPPSWVSFPDHFNYFNHGSFERLLSKAGFEIIYKTTNFPLEMLLISGVDYYSDEQARAKVGGIVSGFNNSFLSTGRKRELTGFYETIAKGGYGRVIDVYAKKSGS
ncbi:MAG: class I SAM-dependent methyltransferase [Defluviitaleaceae bacterium]|nr:class I SAM-dependent methyltransferase [Defluviitaleaceae bacterium]